jgi:hypothetical protein
MPATPPAEVPNAPSQAVAAAPSTPGSTKLASEKGSPTLKQKSRDSSRNSSPPHASNDPNVEQEVDEEGYYEVYLTLPCAAHTAARTIK